VTTETVAAFWASYTEGLPAGDPRRTAPFSVFAFGDSPALAQELATLVLSGRKTATASLPIQFADEGAPLPQAGDLSVVTLWDGTPVAIIETTEIRLVAFSAVDAAFAADEGEGDRSLEWWRAAHRRYFGRVLERLGGEPLKDTSQVVCERFRLVHGGDRTPA
jgi:uncharacterized protein YhfF